MLNEIVKGMDNAAEKINENFQNGSIVEIGENDRGKFTKYGNGKLVQEITLEITSTTFQNWNGWGRLAKTIELPIPFTNKEYAVDVGWSSNHLAIAQTISQEETQFTTYFIRPDTAGGSLGYVTFIAEGRSEE